MISPEPWALVETINIETIAQQVGIDFLFQLIILQDHKADTAP